MNRRSLTGSLLPVLFAALALLLWLGPFSHVPRWSDVGLTDIPTYERSADATAAGRLPYRDVALEYPPGAPVVFYVARFVPGEDYTQSFRILMMVSWVLATAGSVVAAQALRASRQRVIAVGTIMSTTPLLLGSLIGTRYDGVVTAAVAWMIAAAASHRWRWMWGLLIVGVLLKLMPGLLVPCLAVWQAHHVGWARTRRSVAGAAVAGVALVAPVAIAAPSGLWAMIAYHLDRPPQIESSAGAMTLAWHLLTGAPVTVVSQFGSQGPVGRLPDVLARGTMAVAVAALVVLLARYVRTVDRLPEAAARGYFAATLAATILVLAIGSKVLSPQYLLWMVPAALLVPRRPGWAALVLVPVVMVATQSYFPRHYWDLVALQPGPIVAMVARDLLLVGLAVLCWPRVPRRPAGAHGPAT